MGRSEGKRLSGECGASAPLARGSIATINDGVSAEARPY